MPNSPLAHRPYGVDLDHLMVLSRNKIASAKLLAYLLSVPWSENGAGPFSPVYVNDGLTLDFDEAATFTESAFAAIAFRSAIV
jgi:hypothetical protein